jgi:hypothetical protein
MNRVCERLTVTQAGDPVGHAAASRTRPIHGDRPGENLLTEMHGACMTAMESKLTDCRLMV